MRFPCRRRSGMGNLSRERLRRIRFFGFVAKVSHGAQHLGFAFEEGAFVDLQNGRLDGSTDDRGGLDFDPLGRENLAGELTGNDHHVGFDLAVYLGLISNHQDIGREDLAFEMAVYPSRTFELESAFEMTPFLEHDRDVVTYRGKIKRVRAS